MKSVRNMSTSGNRCHTKREKGMKRRGREGREGRACWEKGERGPNGGHREQGRTQRGQREYWVGAARGEAKTKG